MKYKIKFTTKRWSYPKQRKMRRNLKPDKPEHWLRDGIWVAVGKLRRRCMEGHRIKMKGTALGAREATKREGQLLESSW